MAVLPLHSYLGAKLQHSFTVAKTTVRVTGREVRMPDEEKEKEVVDVLCYEYELASHVWGHAECGWLPYPYISGHFLTPIAWLDGKLKRNLV